MDVVTTDFETFWSGKHTLKKMPPTEYVMHPETEIISVSVKLNDQPAVTLFGEDNIKRQFAKVRWNNKLVLGHNMSGFDAMIHAWRLGVRPKMWGCTLAMARPMYAKTCGVSLGALAKHLNVGVKNGAILTTTKGRHLKDFTSDEIESMSLYNGEDSELCYRIFKKLLPTYSAKELFLIHMTIQMLVNARYELDVPMIEQTLDQVVVEKRKVLLELAELLGVVPKELPVVSSTPLLTTSYTADVPDNTPASLMSMQQEDNIIEGVRSVLASAPKFAQLLDQFGVPIPMKESKTAKEKDGTPKFIPALAKTDQEFLDLQEHENPLVAMAASARLSVKSTLLETRLQAFLRAAAACGGFLPVPTRYCGADTTGRWSGEQYNMQNLPRLGKKPKLSDALRMSLKAPKGYKIIVADLSGIELRVNHFLWKVPYSMALYKADAQADLYSAAAVDVYLYSSIDQVTKDQRQLEKVKALGLGFGAGGVTFQTVAKTMGGINLSIEESISAVQSWREKHPEIVKGWRKCHSSLNAIEQGGRIAIDPWSMCMTTYQGIELPSGRMIRYPALRRTVDQKTGYDEWYYGEGRHKAKIYAGKIDENIVQALARDVIADNAIDFYKLTDLMPVMMVHDELVYIVPENEAENLLAELQRIMRTPPVWWKELITWSEGGVADRYGEAK